MTRVRSTVSDPVIAPGEYYKERKNVGGSWAPNGSGSFPSTKTEWVKTVTDVNDPGFYKRRREGSLIVNPFNISTTDLQWGDWGLMSALGTYSDGTLSRTIYTSPLSPAYWRNSGYANYGPDFSVDPDLISALKEKATSEVWAQKVDPEFALGVAVAESKETLMYLYGILQTIRNPLKKLRRDFDSTGRYPKGHTLRDVAWDASADLSQVWLSFRFGLMPLWYDLQDFMKAKLDFTQKVRQTYRRSEASVSTESGGGSTSFMTWNRTKTINVSAHAGLTVDYFFENQMAFLRHVLGLNNPMELIWELTRLSFVVDYFVNIGEVLRSHTASASVAQEAGWLSFKTDIRTSQTTVANFSSSTPSYTEVWTPSTCTSEFSFQQMDRQPLGNPTWVPQVAVNLDGYRFTDLAALIRGFIG